MWKSVGDLYGSGLVGEGVKGIGEEILGEGNRGRDSGIVFFGV